jgi:hypothetical protein
MKLLLIIIFSQKMFCAKSILIIISKTKANIS